MGGVTVVDIEYKSNKTVGNADLTAADMRKYIRQVRTVETLPEIDTSDERAVAERVTWYLDRCEKAGMKPTVTGLCNALGVSRQTLYNWSRGVYRESTHTALIRRYMALLEELWEIEMLEGKINPIVGIFLGKNHFGYTDGREVLISTRDNTPVIDEQALEQKYIDSVVDDD